MNEQQIQILDEAKKNVTRIFEKKVNPLFVFHNLEHTREVVNASEEIANYYRFNDNDKFILLLSAWFHDTGFSAGKIEGHETESINIATDFLKNHSVDQAVVLQISSCIRSTQMPQKPLNGIEKIICDSDLFHLGTIQFNRRTDLLRMEHQAYYKKGLSFEEWQQGNIEFLISHNYFTGFGQQKLESVKQIWLNRLINKTQKNKTLAI
jgi:HD superfamily phosphodiesterase